MTGTSRDLNHQTESCRRVRGAWKADSEYILELRTEGQSSRTAFLNKGIPLYRLSGRLRREERPLQRQGMISTRRGKWREPFIKKGGNTTALRPFHRMERLFCTETMSRAPRPKGQACEREEALQNLTASGSGRNTSPRTGGDDAKSRSQQARRKTKQEEKNNEQEKETQKSI